MLFDEKTHMQHKIHIILSSNACTHTKKDRDQFLQVPKTEVYSVICEQGRIKKNIGNVLKSLRCLSRILSRKCRICSKLTTDYFCGVGASKLN